MKKPNTLFKITSLPNILTGAVILLVVFLLDTAFAQPNKLDLQLNAGNMFKAPFVSALNTQQSSQSIMQNSDKDIVFIENIGQIRDSKGNERPDILFLTRSQSVDMYITKTGITYVFRKVEGDINARDKATDLKSSYYRLDMEFVGMNKDVSIKKELAVEQQFNYYTPEYPNGISPKGYKKITIENIYDGIDLVYYEKEGKMKYDFIVKAGADFKKIKMKYKGAGTLYIDKDGSVIVTTPIGEVREEKPYTYSRNTGIEIEGVYKVKDNVVQFDIAEYNKSEDIVIDPYRIWATYYGGSDHDRGDGICIDNSGNLYVTGSTKSTNFPTQTLPGAYNQTTLDSLYDVFILKFNSNGARIWATYYGGSGVDYNLGTCTDTSGNLYVTGYTESTNFPIQTLTGAYNQDTLGGGADVFILKFDSNGVRQWATYYGGSSNDYGYSIFINNSGNLHVTGRTNSSNFPTRTLTGAYNQTIYGGWGDAFILKFNISGTRIWATYYGGSIYDCGYSICTDNSGNLYVTGNTGSTNFPTQTLTGAYNQDTLEGIDDAFILKFNSSAVRNWATYYGGSSLEIGRNICTDNSDNLFVTGSTESTNFPTQILAGAYNQTTFGGGLPYGDAFILKFNSDGVRNWATYYGGSGLDAGRSICTDSSGNLYVTGITGSTNFPTQTLTGAYNQTTNGGGWVDAFILKFNSNDTIIWATYYGGNDSDEGVGIGIDNSDYLYITGGSKSTNFPTQTLPGAYNQTIYGGGNQCADAFILKFSPTPVEIKNTSNKIPVKYSLFQNYPNPFNPTTNIRFDLCKSSHAKLIVYDIMGKEVATLVNDKLGAGSYEVSWDGTDYSSGVYFYRLNTGEYVDVKKMLLVK